MNNLTPIPSYSLPVLAKMSAPERLYVLRKNLSASVESMRNAAAIYAAMQAAGDDTSTIPPSTARMLQRIHATTLLPEVMVQMHGTLRQKVALLPLHDQRRLIEPEATVPYLPSLDAEPVELSVQRLDPDQVRQVFGTGIIRTPEEQLAYLRKQRGEELLAPTRHSVVGAPGVLVDGEAGIATIGEYQYTAKQIRLIAEAMKGSRGKFSYENIDLENIKKRIAEGIPISRLAREAGIAYNSFYVYLKRHDALPK